MVLFESLPGFHVSANIYLPQSDVAGGSNKYPGVLFFCGHSDLGKGSHLYQQVCIDLVRNGFVVLAIDPLGQGERHQFYDPKTGEIPRRNTTEHTYFNQQCAFAGGNVARYMIWDGIRALDYLTNRPEVDSERVGVTGNSGGGLQTAYLMLVDDRIDAAVPCCFITSKEEYMKTGQGQDGEQILYRAIDRGPRYDDFLSAFAPKPVLVGAAQSDFLCVEGAHRSYERARSVYGHYGRQEAIDITIADDTHGFSPHLREGAVNWFREHLQDRAPDFQTGSPRTQDPEDLWCTAAGEVRAEFHDETTATDLIRSYISTRTPDTGSTSEITDIDRYTDEMRKTVVKQFDLNRHRPTLYPRHYDKETVDGVTWEKVFFRSECDPTVIVTGIEARVEDEDVDTPLVLLYEHGTDEVEARESEIKDLVTEHGFVLAFDPRGVGAVRARDVNTPLMNGGNYDDYHGTKDKLTSDAIMLGTSLVALQVFDLTRACDYLRDRFGTDANLAIEGHGSMAAHTLLTAVTTPSLRTVSLVNPLPSFRELAITREMDIDHGLTIHGIIGRFDIPQLLPALHDREIRCTGAGSSN
ncbi:alpha/beta hydrolase family protein [Haladaptatus litoreus]|nr:prolyl oligopeptidase family serine peptidase [Haladaptatus litoreus]